MNYCRQGGERAGEGRLRQLRGVDRARERLLRFCEILTDAFEVATALHAVVRFQIALHGVLVRLRRQHLGVKVVGLLLDRIGRAEDLIPDGLSGLRLHRRAREQRHENESELLE